MNKNTSKFTKNIKNNNKNEIYNYICIGIIVIIIVYFICKEQKKIINNEGFQATLSESESESVHSRMASSLYNNHTALKNFITTIEDKKNTINTLGYSTFDILMNIDENDYETYIDKLTELKDHYKEGSNRLTKLKTELEEFEEEKSNWDSKVKTIAEIDYTNLNVEINSQNTILTRIDTYINNKTDMIENSKSFTDETPINSEDFTFNLTMPMIMHLKENPTDFYIYIRLNNSEIYGPIILETYNKYKLKNINANAIDFNSVVDIKIKIEDIANDLFEKNIDLILDVINIDNSDKINLYGIDLNNNKNVFSKDNLISASLLSSKLKNIYNTKKDNLKSTLSIEYTNYEKKIENIKKKYNNSLRDYGMLYNYGNISSLFKEEFDNKIQPISIYYDSINDTDRNNLNITELIEKDKEKEEMRNLCDILITEEMNKLNKLIIKYQNIEKTITNNKFEQSDKNSVRIIGNYTPHFSDGIIPVGKFSLTID